MDGWGPGVPVVAKCKDCSCCGTLLFVMVFGFVTDGGALEYSVTGGVDGAVLTPFVLVYGNRCDGVFVEEGPALTRLLGPLAPPVLIGFVFKVAPWFSRSFSANLDKASAVNGSSTRSFQFVQNRTSWPKLCLP